MASNQLDSTSSDRICKHMNKDHQDAINKYVVHYGGIKEFKEASMITINTKFMELKVDNNLIQINFEHELLDSRDAHQTLVSMMNSIPNNEGRE